VDAQPDIYTVAALLDMKASHEMRVRRTEQPVEWLHQVEALGHDLRLSGARPVNFWRFEFSVVVAYSFGSTPIVVREECWRGSGLEFAHIHGSEGSETLLISSEGKPDIEYWCDNGVLHVVESTYGPSSGSLVPFVERCFHCGSYPANRTVKLLMTARRYSSETLSQLLTKLKEPDKWASRNYERLLYELRDVGLAKPEVVLRELRDPEIRRYLDGAVAETASSIVEELELILLSTNSAHAIR
jgi:hypothetical protein